MSLIMASFTCITAFLPSLSRVSGIQGKIVLFVILMEWKISRKKGHSDKHAGAALVKQKGRRQQGRPQEYGLDSAGRETSSSSLCCQLWNTGRETMLNIDYHKELKLLTPTAEPGQVFGCFWPPHLAEVQSLGPTTEKAQSLCLSMTTGDRGKKLVVRSWP